jgi:hypothetical protein
MGKALEKGRNPCSERPLARRPLDAKQFRLIAVHADGTGIEQLTQDPAVINVEEEAVVAVRALAGANPHSTAFKWARRQKLIG